MDCIVHGVAESDMTEQLKVKVKVAQSSPTLWDPMDYTVREILQARILEWVAVPFSRGASQPRDQTQVSCIASGFFTQLSHKRSPLLLKSAVVGSPCLPQRNQTDAIGLVLLMRKK